MLIKRAIILGVMVFTVALLVKAPATLMSNLIAHYSEQHVLLTETVGGFWKGGAQVVLRGNTDQDQVNAGHIDWELFPLQLALGRVYTALSWNNAPPFWLTAETSRVHIEHAALEMPATVVTQFIPSMNAAQLGGQLSFRSESLSITRSAIEGEASIDWAQATSPLSPINPLGNYHAQVTGIQNGINIQLTAQTGPLMLDGNGHWSSANGLDFQGVAKADPNKQKALSQLLHILGNEQTAGSGVFQLSLKTN